MKVTTGENQRPSFVGRTLFNTKDKTSHLLVKMLRHIILITASAAISKFPLFPQLENFIVTGINCLEEMLSWFEPNAIFPCTTPTSHMNYSAGWLSHLDLFD